MVVIPKDVWNELTRAKKIKYIIETLPPLRMVDFNGYPGRGYHWRHGDLNALANGLNIVGEDI